MRRATYDDVAQRAGVSKTTVSFVMRGLGNGKIPETTRKKVLDAAEELGYYPNNLIRSLQRGRTQTLALVAPRLSMEYVALVVEGVREAASAAGYAVLIAQSSVDEDQERASAEQLLHHRVDGVIRFTLYTDPGLMPAWLDSAVKRKVPCVVIDDVGLAKQVDCVASDNFAGALEMVRHLIAKGHRRIGHIRGSLGKTSAQERLSGYQQALKEAGIPFDSALTVGEDYASTSLAEDLDCLLRAEPTAIFAASDVLAIETRKLLAQKGLPDIEVTGFDGILRAIELEIPTVEQPFTEMGKEAVKMLIRRIEHPGAPLATERLPCRLRVPAS